MNTIASLTRSNPAVAEQAVQDLADLFPGQPERPSADTNHSRGGVWKSPARTKRIEELRLGAAVARRVED